MPRPGSVVGPFQVLGRLGEGGMATVFRAQDASGRQVALKVAKGSAPRLAREGQAAAAIDHPNVLKVFDAGQAAGVAYIAYELVEGARGLHEAWERLEWFERIELLQQAIAGVAAAHALGISHRDLKPDNVLVDPEGRARVADFGLALIEEQERLTQTGAVLGTPHYMSPEQVSGTRSEQGPASDVWSLGVLLYQALTDDLPFTGNSLMELVASICTGAPPPPRSLVPSVSPALERVCLQALAPRGSDRYPDAGAFGAALEEASLSTSRGWRWLGLPLGALLVLGSLGVFARTFLEDPGQAAQAEQLAQEAPSQPAIAEAAQELLEQVSRHVKAREGEAALSAVELFLQSYPDHAEAWQDKGYALYLLGSKKEALGAFSRALELDPSLISARANRGVLRSRFGDPEGGLQDLDHAARLAPQEAFVFSKRATLHCEAGRVAIALQDAERALRLEPDLVEGFAARARIYSAMGKLELALQDMDASLRIAADSRTYLNRAVLRARLKRWDLAERDLARAQAEQGRSKEFLILSALVSFKRKAYPRAERSFRRLLRQAPQERPRWLFQRAQLYRAQGKSEKARRDLEEIVRDFPAAPQVQQARRALRALGGRR